jgi:hypothetical protein
MPKSADDIIRQAKVEWVENKKSMCRNGRGGW